MRKTVFAPVEGDIVSAFYSADGAYRNATITSRTAKGTAVITFLGYQTQTEAEMQALRRPVEPNQVCFVASFFCSEKTDKLLPRTNWWLAGSVTQFTLWTVFGTKE